ncbi:hypothetical protein P4S72_25105 [Vibrio sp. PP-XX7]
MDAVIRQRAGKKPLFRVQKIILFGSYARQPDEQGIELFSEGTRELAQPGNLTDEEKRAISQKHFDIWFKKAKDNVTKFNFSFNHPDIDIASSAFDLHQATEALFAYVEGRYSDHYEITEEELTYLAEEVVKLKALVAEICLARLGG